MSEIIAAGTQRIRVEIGQGAFEFGFHASQKQNAPGSFRAPEQGNHHKRIL